jgi:hypothetical protein
MGTPISNHSRWLRDERWTVTRRPSAAAQDNARRHHCLCSTREILARATMVQIRRDWSLWHQNDEVRPFLLSLCVGGSNKDRATAGSLLLGSWSTASSTGEAPVPFSLPTAVEVAREAFPGLGRALDVAKRHNDDEVRCLGFDHSRTKF